jgi:hypothetical protein
MSTFRPIHPERLIGASLAFLGFALIMHAATDLDTGAGFNAGSGTFPMIIGQLLAGLGLWSVLFASPARDKAIENLSPRRVLGPLFWVTIGVLVFAAVLRPGGFGLAILGCLACLGRATPGLGYNRLLWLWLVTSGGCWLIFSVVLNRPLLFLPPVFSAW